MLNKGVIIMKKSMLHITVCDKEKRILLVKITTDSYKAMNTACNNALRTVGHNQFTMYTYKVLLAERHTKPFKFLLNFHVSNDEALDTLVQNHIEYLKREGEI